MIKYKISNFAQSGSCSLSLEKKKEIVLFEIDAIFDNSKEIFYTGARSHKPARGNTANNMLPSYTYIN
jgi:hypothetical protein